MLVRAAFLYSPEYPLAYILFDCMEKHTSQVRSVCLSDVSTSHKSPRTLEVLLLQCHYVKVFGDGDYSFYCGVMSMLLAEGHNKLVFLSIISSGRISANMSGDRMIYALC